MSDEQAPLVLVSNRGPVTYQEDGSVKRGTGGLVTALTGLASHRDAIWIASAMTDQDVDVAREHGGKPFEVEAPEGGSFRIRFVESDDEAYDRFYNIIANPMLWFIQHYLWDLSNAPDIRRHEVDAFEQGYQAGQPRPRRGRDRRDRGPGRAGRDGPRLPPLHAAGDGPRSAAGRLPAPLRAHPVDAAGRLARAADGAARADLPRAAGQRHHRLPHALLPAQLPAVLPRPARPRGRLRARRRRAATTARCGCAPTRCRSTTRRRGRSPAGRACASSRSACWRRRREFAILRVDRADLSKNVLRGFTAFDIFLEQHPEFAERITFTAQLMPSRTDVPEYAEYLEKIEALVAVVNHRHGTPDWMPIDLKLRDDLDEAVASYKHYDVMMVNAMFDGMNLVAKEGPLVNERHGVSILSENTGAHEELGEFALSREPVRRPGARRRDLLGADHVAGGARAPRPRPEGDRHLARSGRLDRRADRRHPRQARAPRRRAGELSARSRTRRSARRRAAPPATTRRRRGRTRRRPARRALASRAAPRRRLSPAASPPARLRRRAPLAARASRRRSLRGRALARAPRVARRRASAPTAGLAVAAPGRRRRAAISGRGAVRRQAPAAAWRRSGHTTTPASAASDRAGQGDVAPAHPPDDVAPHAPPRRRAPADSPHVATIRDRNGERTAHLRPHAPARPGRRGRASRADRG